MPKLKSAFPIRKKKPVCRQSDTFPCGYSCKNQYYVNKAGQTKETQCKKLLGGQAKTLMEWQKLQAERIDLANKKRGKAGLKPVVVTPAMSVDQAKTQKLIKQKVKADRRSTQSSGTVIKVGAKPVDLPKPLEKYAQLRLSHDPSLGWQILDQDGDVLRRPKENNTMPSHRFRDESAATRFAQNVMKRVETLTKKSTSAHETTNRRSTQSEPIASPTKQAWEMTSEEYGKSKYQQAIADAIKSEQSDVDSGFGGKDFAQKAKARIERLKALQGKSYSDAVKGYNEIYPGDLSHELEMKHVGEVQKAIKDGKNVPPSVKSALSQTRLQSGDLDKAIANPSKPANKPTQETRKRKESPSIMGTKQVSSEDAKRSGLELRNLALNAKITRTEFVDRWLNEAVPYGELKPSKKSLNEKWFTRIEKSLTKGKSIPEDVIESMTPQQRKYFEILQRKQKSKLATKQTDKNLSSQATKVKPVYDQAKEELLDGIPGLLDMEISDGLKKIDDFMDTTGIKSPSGSFNPWTWFQMAKHEQQFSSPKSPTKPKRQSTKKAKPEQTQGLTQQDKDVLGDETLNKFNLAINEGEDPSLRLQAKNSLLKMNATLERMLGTGQSSYGVYQTGVTLSREELTRRHDAVKKAIKLLPSDDQIMKNKDEFDRTRNQSKLDQIKSKPLKDLTEDEFVFLRQQEDGVPVTKKQLTDKYPDIVLDDSVGGVRLKYPDYYIQNYGASPYGKTVKEQVRLVDTHFLLMRYNEIQKGNSPDSIGQWSVYGNSKNVKERQPTKPKRQSTKKAKPEQTLMPYLAKRPEAREALGEYQKLLEKMGDGGGRPMETKAIKGLLNAIKTVQLPFSYGNKEDQDAVNALDKKRRSLVKAIADGKKYLHDNGLSVDRFSPDYSIFENMLGLSLEHKMPRLGQIVDQWAKSQESEIKEKFNIKTLTFAEEQEEDKPPSLARANQARALRRKPQIRYTF